MKPDQAVLAAIDLSAGSRAVVAQAARICGICDRRLHLIHVIESPTAEDLAGDTPAVPSGDACQSLTGARRALEQIALEAAAPADTVLHLRIGTPAAEILACVERVAPVLLLLGENGLSTTAFKAEPLLPDSPAGRATKVLLVEEGG